MSVPLYYVFICGDGECVEVGEQLWGWFTSEFMCCWEGTEPGKEVLPEGTWMCERCRPESSHAMPLKSVSQDLSLHALWMGFEDAG